MLTILYDIPLFVSKMVGITGHLLRRGLEAHQRFHASDKKIEGFELSGLAIATIYATVATMVVMLFAVSSVANLGPSDDTSANSILVRFVTPMATLLRPWP